MFRLAKKDEADKLNQIIVQAAKRIQEKGSKQWSSMLDGSALQEVQEKIEKQEAYVLEVNNEIAGMLYASKEPSIWDENIWGSKATVPAHYIHRVAVADGFQGQQVPHVMLRELQKQKSGLLLRLDCIAHQKVLNRLYTEVGFVHVDEKKNHPARGEQIVDFNLYEYHNEKY